MLERRNIQLKVDNVTFAMLKERLSKHPVSNYNGNIVVDFELWFGNQTRRTDDKEHVVFSLLFSFLCHV